MICVGHRVPSLPHWCGRPGCSCECTPLRPEKVGESCEAVELVSVSLPSRLMPVSSLVLFVSDMSLPYRLPLSGVVLTLLYLFSGHIDTRLS